MRPARSQIDDSAVSARNHFWRQRADEGRGKFFAPPSRAALRLYRRNHPVVPALQAFELLLAHYAEPVQLVTHEQPEDLDSIARTLPERRGRCLREVARRHWNFSDTQLELDDLRHD